MSHRACRDVFMCFRQDQIDITLILMPNQTHKTSLVVTKDNSHTLFSEQFGATYHSTHGAIQESKHVFIQNGLEFYVQKNGTSQLSILEIGFGTGLNALLTHEFAQKKQLSVNYHSIEAFPISVEDAMKLNYTDGLNQEVKESFLKMHQGEFGLVTLINSFFSLTKHHSPIEDFRLNQQFDIIYFDAFSPSQQPELWTESVFQNMFNLLKPGGILVTYCAQGQMKRHMKAAGFNIVALQGPPGKREMTKAEKM